MEQRRTQAARSQAAQDQILQAALTIFAFKGYAASSMDDICRAAGCSKGGLYHHFRTKAAVLTGVVDKLAAKGALLPPLEQEAAVPATALGRVLLDVWAEAARDAALRERLHSIYESVLDAGAPQVDAGLGRMLRIGTLIQLLTRGEDLDVGRVAVQLGIERAA